MPTPDHDDTNFVAGDDWCIGGTLLDRDGNPLDLTNTSIAWTLLDPSGAPVNANAIITVLDPPTAGMVNIKLTCRNDRRARSRPLHRSATDYAGRHNINLPRALSGIVTLMNDRRDKSCIQSRSCRGGDLAPCLHGRGSERPVASLLI